MAPLLVTVLDLDGCAPTSAQESSDPDAWNTLNEQAYLHRLVLKQAQQYPARVDRV